MALNSNRNHWGLGWILLLGLSGCMGPLLRTAATGTVASEPSTPAERQLIQAVAHPYGMTYMKVENVSLMTGLPGTGEDPAPSPQRAALLAEMVRREVVDPNGILASPNTALVLVRGILRPGIQAGEPFDVEVSVPSRSSTTSLRGGWLLETPLTETAVLGQQIRKGRVMAVAGGPLLVDPSATADDDPVLATRGTILGGGVASKDRSLGLILDHEHQSIRLSQAIGKSINARFYTHVDGRQQGVATPKTDEFIELILHPRYRANVHRYMRVVRSIAVQENPIQQQQRIEQLRDQLLDPVTSSSAALRLEAIGGNEAIAVLKEGIASEDREVRFYAAEALAYLDQTAAVEPLAKAANEERAFRINALAALSAMEDGAAYDALRSMLSSRSAETRYGAFRALWTMDADDPVVRGEDLAGQFQYHQLHVGGPEMIHATSSHQAEIVLFGEDHYLKLPLVLDAGSRILVNGLEGDQITVSSFGPGQPTQQRVVSVRVDDVIRAVVELGGTYPDVVQMLQQANDANVLSSRFRVNALPEAGRSFDRIDNQSSATQADDLPADEPGLAL
jgi:flagellar basal body P-ring protein FlgI